MVYYNLLRRMILGENYTTKEEMEYKINNFFESGKITETQKTEFLRLLN